MPESAETEPLADEETPAEPILAEEAVQKAPDPAVPPTEAIVEVIEEQVVSKLKDKEKPRPKKARAKKEL